MAEANRCRREGLLVFSLVKIECCLNAFNHGPSTHVVPRHIQEPSDVALGREMHVLQP